MKNKCTAAQMSDQMVCSQCNQKWDVNDICKPECKPLLTSDMTLRDHFAGLAMQTYISTDTIMRYDDEDISAMAYRCADAMMKERLK